MAELNLNSIQFKEVLKAALIEVLQENREEFSEWLTEIIEDIAMEKAIEEGETTEEASREDIFRILEQ